MKSVRVIARLDVKGPNVVKGVQFEALRVLGKPGDLAAKYFRQGADELIYIDIVASLYRRENLLHIVREASKSVFIPFTAGGGVRSIDDIHALLHAGAEKVAINTAATKNPDLLRQAAQRFGSQCVVLSIEAKKVGEGRWEAYTDNGREATGLDVIEWAQEAEKLGAGEILLTSVDNDGTRRGLDSGLIEAVSSAVSIPVIASGGAQSPKEIAQTISHSRSTAVAIGSSLHYGHTTIAQVKDALRDAGCAVRGPSQDERAITVQSEEAPVENYNRYTLRQHTEGLTVQTSPPQESTPTASAHEADIVIVDYGINNVRSVAMAFESFGKKVAFAKSPDDILVAKRLVLPGVGAFADGMKALRKNNLDEAIKKYIESDKPFLGICLGMQLLFSASEEFGHHEGLDVIPGNVIFFPPPANDSDYTLPHIGWNTIHPPHGDASRWRGTLFEDVRPGECMYFVHSLYPVPKDPSVVLATCSYGGKDFCAAVIYRNAIATQFHIEKSGNEGLALLRKFCEEKYA